MGLRRFLENRDVMSGPARMSYTWIIGQLLLQSRECRLEFIHKRLLLD
jgi:hypothetical protein